MNLNFRANPQKSSSSELLFSSFLFMIKFLSIELLWLMTTRNTKRSVTILKITAHNNAGRCAVQIDLIQ